jgi:hypothetical protein
MKLKLEIEFDSEEQMARVTEAIAASNRVQQVFPDSAVEEVTDEQMTLPVDQEEPSSSDIASTDNAKTVETSKGDDSEQPAKRKRRTTKADRNNVVVPTVAPATKAVDTTADSEVLTDEERKQFSKEVAVQMEKNVAAQETVAPKNFYSLSEFLNNFAVILNNLVKDGTLSHRSLTEYCSQYGVPFIYALAKDKKKLEDFYNLLIKQGHIVKKGDY